MEKNIPLASPLTIKSLAAGQFVVDDQAFMRLSKLFFTTTPCPQDLASVIAKLPAGTRDVLDEDTSCRSELRFNSMLDFAVKDGHAWALPLLALAFDPNERPPSFEPLIFSAIRRGEAFALALLSSRRVDLSARDASTTTPLGSAASLSRVETLQTLLSLGADPLASMDIPVHKKQPETGITPLMIAARMGSLECLDLLLPVSDIQARDGLGRDAEDHARSSSSPRSGDALAKVAAHKLARAEKSALAEALTAGPATRTPRQTL